MKLGFALALLALTGCESTQKWTHEHPTATRIIKGSLVLTAAGYALDSRGHGPIQHDVATPSVTCDGGNCK